MSTLGDESSSFGHYAFIHESVPAAEILHVFGDIDLSSVESFNDAIRRAERPRRTLLVDLTGCEYIGATGLSALLGVYRRLGNGVRVAVTPGGIPARLFALLPSHVPFLVAPSLETGLRPQRVYVGEN